MPLVEGEIGERLSSLIERAVSKLKRLLWPGKVTDAQGHWLLKSAFWLVAAKILGDKRVPAFSGLDVSDVDDVFSCVGTHYGTKQRLRVRGAAQRTALREVARDVSRFSSLRHVTTESLAYVYENALVSRETRSALSTHSTPPYLVDYIVWQAVGSQEAIESRIGEPVRTFAYPSGSYDQQVIDVIQSAHFWTAITTRYGTEVHSSKLFEIPRIRIRGADTLDQFIRKVEAAI